MSEDSVETTVQIPRPLFERIERASREGTLSVDELIVNALAKAFQAPLNRDFKHGMPRKTRKP
jgi:hypothetical protein